MSAHNMRMQLPNNLMLTLARASGIAVSSSQEYSHAIHGFVSGHLSHLNSTQFLACWLSNSVGKSDGEVGREWEWAAEGRAQGNVKSQEMDTTQAKQFHGRHHGSILSCQRG